MSVTLRIIGCGMTAPEFSANHTHDLDCYRPATIGDLIEALQAEGAIDYDAALTKAQELAGGKLVYSSEKRHWAYIVEHVVDAALGLDTLVSREGET